MNDPLMLVFPREEVEAQNIAPLGHTALPQIWETCNHQSGGFTPGVGVDNVYGLHSGPSGHRATAPGA